jgi:hypothetical protein
VLGDTDWNAGREPCDAADEVFPSAFAFDAPSDDSSCSEVYKRSRDAWFTMLGDARM